MSERVRGAAAVSTPSAVRSATSWVRAMAWRVHASSMCGMDSSMGRVGVEQWVQWELGY